MKIKDLFKEFFFFLSVYYLKICPWAFVVSHESKVNEDKNLCITRNNQKCMNKFMPLEIMLSWT